MEGRRKLRGWSAMKLRCFFNCHPWNYRTVGEVAIRLCKAGCNGPQYWADGQWKPLESLREIRKPDGSGPWQDSPSPPSYSRRSISFFSTP